MGHHPGLGGKSTAPGSKPMGERRLRWNYDAGQGQGREMGPSQMTSHNDVSRTRGFSGARWMNKGPPPRYTHPNPLNLRKLPHTAIGVCKWDQVNDLEMGRLS